MKVLVLGGSGWVGGGIARVFMDAGHEVTVCSRGRRPLSLDGCGVVTLDKTDAIALRGLFAEDRFEVVIDSVPREETVLGVFEYARGLRHYLHCSSTGGYAPLPYIPCDESAEYGGFGGGWKAVKKVVDELVLGLFRDHGFPATVIRPCYISGPGALPLDNLGGRRGDFISDLASCRMLDVLNDGRALLQPVDVRDLCRAFLLAVESPERSVGEVFNICSDRAVTFNRYLEICAGALGRKPEINYLSLSVMLEKYAGRVDETGLRFLAEHMCFSIAKATRLIGYSPEHDTESVIAECAQRAFAG